MMADIYEAAPDARQLPDEVPQLVTRFRPRYRQLNPDEVALHDEIKTTAENLAVLIEQVKPGRYRSLGMTALEESVMWTIKELTS